MSGPTHASWANDDEFVDSIITAVSRERIGWSITKADGWSFFVPASSPVEPTVGMAVRMYGKGIGSVVRGLFLAGQCVFYRTEEEQRQHTADELYGRDAADVVARWDEGRSIWSIAMGGFGPGYEQALQVAMVEFLRDLVAGVDDEAALSDRLQPLGLSGAQWGAAKALAQQFNKSGPQAILKSLDDQRKIQVSRNFPTLEVVALRDLVARAIPIIETERQCLADSHSVGGELWIDPDDEGDQQARASLEAMDAWLETAKKAIAS